MAEGRFDSLLGWLIGEMAPFIPDHLTAAYKNHKIGSAGHSF